MICVVFLFLKTQVHRNGCVCLGQRGSNPCDCPLRLSYKTVDSYIGKRRSIFHAVGRDGEWDRRLGLGNPAADKLVKDYLRVVTAEQLQARVTPKQATPFFVDKLTRLSSHLQRELDNAKTPIQRFIVARDQVYFKTRFFSGDRPSDLDQVKLSGILRFPNDVGFLFNHVWGKTLRDGHENVFGIRRNPHTSICPIRGIEQYIEVARQMRVHSVNSWLFISRWHSRFTTEIFYRRGPTKGVPLGYGCGRRGNAPWFSFRLCNYVGCQGSRAFRDNGPCWLVASTYCDLLSSVSQSP